MCEALGAGAVAGKDESPGPRLPPTEGADGRHTNLQYVRWGRVL